MLAENLHGEMLKTLEQVENVDILILTEFIKNKFFHEHIFSGGLSKLLYDDIERVPHRTTFIPELCFEKDVLTIGCVAMIEMMPLNEIIDMGYHVFYNTSQKAKYSLGLDINENVAHIVRQIFAWRVEGYSTYAINTKLNEMNVPTPTTYKNSIGLNINPVNAKNSKVVLWNETTVRKILANEAYIGNVVQNKSTTKNHRTKKKVNIEESNWIKVEATHEPIIDIETWDKVQSMVKKRTRVSTDGKLNIFAGV